MPYSGSHDRLTEKILKCAFDVQNTLGCGFLEKVYENALIVALQQEEGLKVQQQVPLRVHFREILVGEYIADLIVDGTVLVEIKATESNPPIYVAQVLNYLKATHLPVGMLLNFGRPKLYYRRLALRKMEKNNFSSPPANSSSGFQEDFCRDTGDARDKE